MTELETEQEGFPAVLDLSSADLSGNQMENGWKDALIYEATPVKTENAEGKLPVGTPGIKIQFKVDGGQYDNRRAFNNYWMPPASYDPEKRARSLGMLAKFLEAVGFTDVTSPTFDIAAAIADMPGRECQINTKYDPDWDNNKVQGVKARNAGGNAGGGLL